MSASNIYNEIQASLKRGERIAVATVVKAIGAAPCGVGTKLLVHADGSTSGSLSGAKVDAQAAQEAMQALREGHSHLVHIHLDADQAVGSCGATLELFIEVLYPEPRLIIAGAGYVAQALARLATSRKLYANSSLTRQAGSSSSRAGIISTRTPCAPLWKPMPAM